MQWRHWVVVLGEVSETVAVLEGCFTHIVKWCKKFSKLYLSLSHFKYIYIYICRKWFAGMVCSASFLRNVLSKWHNYISQITMSQKFIDACKYFKAGNRLFICSIFLSCRQNKIKQTAHDIQSTTTSGPCLPSRAKSSHGRVICTGLFVRWFNLDPFYTDPEIWLWDMFTPPHSFKHNPTDLGLLLKLRSVQFLMILSNLEQDIAIAIQIYQLQ